MANLSVIRLRVAELLAEAGINQTELARRSGVPRPTINKMVNHPEKVRMIGFSTLSALCVALSVRPGDILEYRPD